MRKRCGRIAAQAARDKPPVFRRAEGTTKRRQEYIELGIGLKSTRRQTPTFPQYKIRLFRTLYVARYGAIIASFGLSHKDSLVK